MTSRGTHSLVSGILALTFLLSGPRRAAQGAQTHGQPGQQPEEGRSPQKSPNFTLTRMAHGITKDGAPFSQNTFERVPGEKVYVLMIHFPSSDGVRKEFAVKVNAATKIIERNKSTDRNGITEERAVVTFKTKDGQIVTMILTTAGTVLREVQSYSSQAALEFEKQAKANEADAKR